MSTTFAQMMHQQPSTSIQVPALYLYPLNDTFVPKHIHLPPGQRVKIGRQTNAKTAPGERNGYFDSKVLSRQHAEVWEEDGKIYIKDVKSSNGTFINAERLSPESQESPPFELNTDNIVEFGIDIVGEDNKTIVHHKVAARVVCVFTQEDAQAAARAEQHQNPPAGSSPVGHPGSSNGTVVYPFATGQAAPGARRPPMQQQALAGIGGMGANMRQPGKSGLTFDHILNRLQGELQKSRETGAELHSLTGAMNDIHDTLGGNLPQPLASYHPQFIPPVMPPQAPATTENNSTAPSSGALADLQVQLQAAQRSLADYAEKFRVLEAAFAGQDSLKQELSSLRDMLERLESERRELDLVRAGRHRHNLDQDEHDFAHDGDDDDDDDDSHSIATVTPHELERVEEEDEEQLAAEEEEERRSRRDELRPRTPEPTGMGIYDEDQHAAGSSRTLSPSGEPSLSSVTSLADERMSELTTQLESVLEVSRTLQAQHSSAQSTISMLEAKVTALESMVETTQGQVQTYTAEMAVERTSLTALVTEWKESMEGQWSCVRGEWSQECARLARAREEWEARMRANEDTIALSIGKLDIGLASIRHHQRSVETSFNGTAHTGGLVTPPSPRSLSSDSGSGSNKRRRRRSSSPRGRPRAHSVGSAKDDDSSSEGASHLDDKVSTASAVTGVFPHYPASRGTHLWMAGLDRDGDMQPALRKNASYPITPDPSIRKSSTGSSLTMTTEDDVGTSSAHVVHSAPNQRVFSHAHIAAALGALAVGVAVGAVVWRVKPE